MADESSSGSGVSKEASSRTSYQLRQKGQARQRAWLKRYPPLATFFVALAIAAIVLPSALNLPQANPSQVLEYAPVPPKEDTPPDIQGSIASLGLGTTASLRTGLAPDPLQTGPGGKGKKPVTKRCVGKPARQTEDLNSPPCVGFFEGDNGGQTWQGVTGDEIIVLNTQSTSITVATEDGSQQTPPAGSYCDVDRPPDTQPTCLDANRNLYDHFRVKATRALSRYFNDRFQTYGRRVHFYVYWSGCVDNLTCRRADAHDNWQRLKPFAVLDHAFFGGFASDYAESMALRRSLVFGSLVGLPNSYYRRHAPMIWSFFPDLEHQADMYASYICQKVAPNPVQHAGDDKQAEDMNGKPRRYAFMYTTDPGWPGLKFLATQIKQKIANCPNGAKLDVAEPSITYSRNQWSTDTHPDAHAEARTNIAKMQASKVTTVLWLGGYDTAHSNAAADARWFPEWIVAGDSMNDSINNTRDQNRAVWQHAWVVSNYLRRGERVQDAPCIQAYRESEPKGANDPEFAACVMYRNFFTLFKAIQVAGPYLSPEAVDQGQHAIPKQSSTSPYVAACYFDPGDYTCVKDAVTMWWDPLAPDPEGSPDERGCYRMVDDGRRYLAGEWDRSGEVFANRQDPCNDTSADQFINPYGPAG